jgi:hypothetical protein
MRKKVWKKKKKMNIEAICFSEVPRRHPAICALFVFGLWDFVSSLRSPRLRFVAKIPSPKHVFPRSSKQQQQKRNLNKNNNNKKNDAPCDLCAPCSVASVRHRRCCRVVIVVSAASHDPDAAPEAQRRRRLRRGVERHR